MKRLAVLLVGEYRTWPIASAAIFNFFNNRAEQIDYYFVTWDKSGEQFISDADITDYFQNKNLIAYKRVPVKNENHTYYKQTYLAKVANILKRTTEQTQEFVYDQVVETRPDMFLRPNGLEWKLCPDFYHRISIVDEYYLGQPWMLDLYYRSSSLTNDILSNRYYNCVSKFNDLANQISGVSFRNHHWYLARYVMDHNLISMCNSMTDVDYEFHTVIRPNFPTEVLSLSNKELWQYSEDWRLKQNA